MCYKLFCLPTCKFSAKCPYMCDKVQLSLVLITHAFAFNSLIKHSIHLIDLNILIQDFVYRKSENFGD